MGGPDSKDQTKNLDELFSPDWGLHKRETPFIQISSFYRHCLEMTGILKVLLSSQNTPVGFSH